MLAWDGETLRHRDITLVLENGQQFVRLTDDDDGWVDWTGGDRPVPFDALVEARLFGGTTVIAPADHFIWQLRTDPEAVVAYRVVKP